MDIETMRTGVDGVYLTSAGTHHWAKVAVEAWSVKPGPVGDNFDEHFEHWLLQF
ncbi:hypothetical protein [Actinokineospora terrae]|uniref:hypothetical protein n=1 Tax=Actinokineospora terrae TaxID=155974 RepID=UPI0015A5599D|nr:hypothetical protein [Actinokineospora terrae]